MRETVFLAGATGVIGTRLLPLLVDAGYEVFGSTRSAAKCLDIEASGAHAVVVDIFDQDALTRAMLQIQPTIVVHQLTDLPRQLDPTHLVDALKRNARIRTDGTRHLVAAALAAGSTRIVAQSIAWAYAPGPKPYAESQPLDLAAEGNRAITVSGVKALERLVLESAPLRGTVLRYGNLYGAGTGVNEPTGLSPVHADAAAHAALLAVQRDAQGVFNIVEPNATVDGTKATRELGWHATFRLAD